uniref:hypothetical protein n=1 Tax=Serratia marcescens TaxID=615 RepID=UPI0013DB8DB8
AETGDRLHATVTVNGDELDRRLSVTGQLIAQAIAQRTTAARSAIGDVGIQVVETLTEKAQDVQLALYRAGETVTTSISERTAGLK